MANKYRSGFERAFAKTLDSYGLIWDYEEETFKYTIDHRYTPDFKLHKKSGGFMYVETKGYFEAKDRTKTLAVLKQYPEMDLRFIFVRASNRLNPRSNTTYASWCDKKGILWAEGTTLPEAWLNECKAGKREG